MDVLVVLIAAAVLNRVRGGGFGAGRLPGHTRLWATGGLFLVLRLVGMPWPLAATWAIGYFVWSTLPVNRWDVLGRVEQTTWPTTIEEAIEATSFNLRHFGLPSDHGCLLVRETAGALTALVAVAIVGDTWWMPALAPLYGLAAVGVTELAHRLPIAKFRVASELLVGPLWGGLILIG